MPRRGKDRPTTKVRTSARIAAKNAGATTGITSANIRMSNRVERPASTILETHEIRSVESDEPIATQTPMSPGPELLVNEDDNYHSHLPTDTERITYLEHSNEAVQTMNMKRSISKTPNRQKMKRNTRQFSSRIEAPLETTPIEECGLGTELGQSNVSKHRQAGNPSSFVANSATANAKSSRISKPGSALRRKRRRSKQKPEVSDISRRNGVGTPRYSATRRTTAKAVDSGTVTPASASRRRRRRSDEILELLDISKQKEEATPRTSVLHWSTANANNDEDNDEEGRIASTSRPKRGRSTPRDKFTSALNKKNRPKNTRDLWKWGPMSWVAGRVTEEDKQFVIQPIPFYLPIPDLTKEPPMHYRLVWLAHDASMQVRRAVNVNNQTNGSSADGANVVNGTAADNLQIMKNVDQFRSGKTDNYNDSEKLHQIPSQLQPYAMVDEHKSKAYVRQSPFLNPDEARAGGVKSSARTSRARNRSFKKVNENYKTRNDTPVTIKTHAKRNENLRTCNREDSTVDAVPYPVILDFPPSPTVPKAGRREENQLDDVPEEVAEEEIVEVNRNDESRFDEKTKESYIKISVDSGTPTLSFPENTARNKILMSDQADANQQVVNDDYVEATSPSLKRRRLNCSRTTRYNHTMGKILGSSFSTGNIFSIDESIIEHIVGNEWRGHNDDEDDAQNNNKVLLQTKHRHHYHEMNSITETPQVNNTIYANQVPEQTRQGPEHRHEHAPSAVLYSPPSNHLSFKDIQNDAVPVNPTKTPASSHSSASTATEPRDGTQGEYENIKIHASRLEERKATPAEPDTDHSRTVCLQFVSTKDPSVLASLFYSFSSNQLQNSSSHIGCIPSNNMNDEQSYKDNQTCTHTTSRSDCEDDEIKLAEKHSSGINVFDLRCHDLQISNDRSPTDMNAPSSELPSTHTSTTSRTLNVPPSHFGNLQGFQVLTGITADGARTSSLLQAVKIGDSNHHHLRECSQTFPKANMSRDLSSHRRLQNSLNCRQLLFEIPSQPLPQMTSAETNPLAQGPSFTDESGHVLRITNYAYSAQVDVVTNPNHNCLQQHSRTEKTSMATGVTVTLDDIQLGFRVPSDLGVDVFDDLDNSDELADEIRKTMSSLKEIRKSVADIRRVAGEEVDKELAEQDAMDALLEEEADIMVQLGVIEREREAAKQAHNAPKPTRKNRNRMVNACQATRLGD